MRAFFFASVSLALVACTGRDLSLGEAHEPDQPIVRELPDYDEPREIAGLAAEDAKDDDPALSSDLLSLYFNSKRPGGQGQEDIWLAERASLSAPFSEPRAERALNTEDRETGIALSHDGLRIWFSSDRPGGAGALDVYLATRANLGASWSIERVAELSSRADDLVSAVADDEQSLYLARRADDDDDYDLYVARRSDRNSAFSEPEPLSALNSDDEESDAVWLEGTGGLVFTRDEQLVYAPDPSQSADVIALDALNSDRDDRDAWFSTDLSYVVFSSNRSGAYRLYEAQRRR